MPPFRPELAAVALRDSLASLVTEDDEAGRLLEIRNLGNIVSEGKKWMYAQDWAIGPLTLDILKNGSGKVINTEKAKLLESHLDGTRPHLFWREITRWRIHPALQLQTDGPS